MERYEEYKDSGVEWIGEIPAGWSIVPLKSLASFRKGLSITKADLSDVGKPVLSYGQIHSKRHVSSGIEKQLIRYVPESCNALAPAAFAEEGSVIFADTSEDVEGCGNCAYVDVRDGIYAGYHTIIASFGTPDVFPDYSGYAASASPSRACRIVFHPSAFLSFPLRYHSM